MRCSLWFRTRRKFCKAFDGNLAQSRLKWRILTSISTQRVAHLLPVGCAAIWMSKSQCQQWLHRIVYLQSSDIFPGQENVEKLRLKRHKGNKKLREKRRKESKSVKLDRVESWNEIEFNCSNVETTSRAVISQLKMKAKYYWRKWEKEVSLRLTTSTV